MVDIVWFWWLTLKANHYKITKEIKKIHSTGRVLDDLKIIRNNVDGKYIWTKSMKKYND